MLSNAGLIYFSSEKLQTEEDLKPQNFKPLNDFVVTVAGVDVSLSKFARILLNFRNSNLASMSSGSFSARMLL